MFSILLILIPQLLGRAIAAPISTYLNLTAISAANGKSTLECWQLATPFTISQQAGIQGTALLPLGNTTSAFYIVIPGKFDGGLHQAPAVQ